MVSGSIFRQKVCLLHTSVVYSIYSTVGQSIVSIYNLGGIFTLGCMYILTIELPNILHITYYIAKSGVILWLK